MKNLIKSTMAATILLALPVAAQAGVAIKSMDFGMETMPAGSTVIDFDTAIPLGFTLTGGQVRNWNDSAGAAPALADGRQDTSFYLTANAGNPATITAAQGYRIISFLWGSMDAYNTLSLLDRAGAVIASYSGLDVAPPADGNQGAAATNRRVTFTTDGATSPIYGVRFASTQPAFEVDNVAFADTAVPEPATWGMMIAGFGMIGGVLRRRSGSPALA